MNVFEFLESPERASNKVVQLVKHRMQANQKKLKYPVLGQVKKDGVYCLIVAYNGTVRFFSRTGKRFRNCEFLESAWEEESTSDANYVVLAELCNSSYSLEELSGLINPNRVKELDTADSILLDQKTTLYLHDLLRIWEFIDGVSETPYQERFQDLWDAFINMPYSECLYVTTLFSEREVDAFSQRMIASKEEGAVYKHPDAGWVAGRRDHEVTKEVRGRHDDLLITGVEEGKKGKRLGMTGNLLCRFRRGGLPDGEVVILPVDGKYTDADRIAWFNNPELVVGRILHVKSLQLSSKGLLRLPKGQELRVDKVAADF